MNSQGAPITADELARETAHIEGWLTEDEGRTLFEAARQTRNHGAIVEIGSWKGKSTIWLAAGARLAGARPIFAIDPHHGSIENPSADTLRDFRTNLARVGLNDMVVPILKRSEQAIAEIEGPIELLFIDGDHRPESVARDAHLWLPRLADGGTVIFHDVASGAWEGPRQVFRRTVCLSRRFGDIRLVGTMGCGRRFEQLAWTNRLRGSYIDLLLRLYDLKNRIRVPAALRCLAKAVLRWTPLASTLPNKT
jgi:predicted O-methyltransferase YrrM